MGLAIEFNCCNALKIKKQCQLFMYTFTIYIFNSKANSTSNQVMTLKGPVRTLFSLCKVKIEF